MIIAIGKLKDSQNVNFTILLYEPPLPLLSKEGQGWYYYIIFVPVIDKWI